MEWPGKRGYDGASIPAGRYRVEYVYGKYETGYNIGWLVYGELLAACVVARAGHTPRCLSTGYGQGSGKSHAGESRRRVGD